ncbi:hypothetical protein AB0G29_13035 [Streptomyces parvus]|uniref:hypothetical protein n=1 Tax=Streptomyces parvus TaxID=66428 RepID=UPI0033FA419F
MYSAIELVEVWRAPREENAYTSRPDWGQAVKVWSGSGSVQPDKTFESFTPSRDSVTERVTVFLPLAAVVGPADRLTLRGHSYEVDGEPKRLLQTSRRHTRITAWRAIK